MKTIRWNPEKSLQVQENPDRGLSLDLIAEYIQNGAVIGTEVRPNYPDQKAFAVLIEDAVWCVPFRENEDTIFLITAWPDRKMRRKYL